MEIKSYLNLDSVTRVPHTLTKATRPTELDAPAVEPAFENSRALEAQLQEAPDVRPEKVAEAKALISDPAYPPRKTLQRLAVLLAMETENRSSE